MLTWMVSFKGSAVAANEIGWRWLDTTAPMAAVIISLAAFACWDRLVPLMRPLVPPAAAR